jgi:ABC-type multidrug transport system fused ATPase/permease subunit
MVNHGLTTSALFALVGMLDQRVHTREIEAFGGLWGKMPLFSTFFMIFAMASAGLPGLNNFVGEFLILTGTFKVAPLVTALAFIGVALLQQVIAVIVTYLGENVAWTATNALRAELAWHALNLDMRFHNDHTPGELIERIDGDVIAVDRHSGCVVPRGLARGARVHGLLACHHPDPWAAERYCRAASKSPQAG